jgi:hypothetical protein
MKMFRIPSNTVKNDENALEYFGISCKIMKMLWNTYTMERMKNDGNALEYYGIL